MNEQTQNQMPAATKTGLAGKIALVFALVAIAAAIWIRHSGGPAPTAAEVREAPTAIKATGLPLMPMSFERLTRLLEINATNGIKITIVNFWATWCEPCRVEIPEFLEFQSEFAARGLAVEFVNVDSTDLRAEASDFLAGLKVMNPSYYLSEEIQDFMNQVGVKWSGGLPHTLVFMRAPRAKLSWTGQTSIEELKEKVLPLLSAATGS